MAYDSASEVFEDLEALGLIYEGCGASIEVQREGVFRHQKELENATHGRYLTGRIRLPRDYQHFPGGLIVELHAIPSTESEQCLQPNLLHVTVMNQSTRRAEWKTSLTPRHWRIVMRIRDDNAMLLDPETGLEIPEASIGCCLSNGEIILGDGGLLVTVITPLQNENRGNASSVKVQQVVESILNNNYAEGGITTKRQPINAKEITEQFTNKRKNRLAKVELHRCRIKCNFLKHFGPDAEKVSPSVKSLDVCNVKSKDIGSLELYEMSDPRASCTMGQNKTLLSSEYKASTLKNGKGESPIKAVFVIERGEQIFMAEELYPGFNQISQSPVHDSSVAFIVPSQTPNVIKSISRNNETLKVALYRSHDRVFSTRRLPFLYIGHENDDCPFCWIRKAAQSAFGVDGTDEGLRKKMKARRGVTKRKKGNRLTPLGGGGTGPFSPSGYSSTSGIGSPSSYDSFSPQPDKKRRTSNSSAAEEMNLYQVPTTTLSVTSTIEAKNSMTTTTTATNWSGVSEMKTGDLAQNIQGGGENGGMFYNGLFAQPQPMDLGDELDFLLLSGTENSKSLTTTDSDMALNQIQARQKCKGFATIELSSPLSLGSSDDPKRDSPISSSEEVGLANFDNLGPDDMLIMAFDRAMDLKEERETGKEEDDPIKQDQVAENKSADDAWILPFVIGVFAILFIEIANAVYRSG